MGSPHQIRALLRDCAVLWDVEARVEFDGDGVALIVSGERYVVREAPPELRPVRWFLQTPERAAANRPPRAAPSVVALLSALRNALGAEPGSTLRISHG